MKSTSNFSIRARALAGCLAGMLAIAACGSSESGDSERDRNVPIAPLALFSQAVDGVARNKVSDASLVMPIGVSDRVQSNGFTLVGLSTVVIDNTGSRNELNFMQIGPDGGFDPTFGTDAVRRVVVKGESVVQPIMGDDGRFVIPHVALDEAGGQQLVSLSRYDLTTGKLDSSFGEDGTLDITPVYVQDLSSLVVDDEGGVLVVGSESSTQPKWDAWRWTETGLDSTFGNAGRIDLAPPTNVELAFDESFTCVRPTLAPRRDGRILAVYSCLKLRVVAKDDGTQSSIYERLIASREFTADGVALESTTVVSLDEPTETTDAILWANIYDVDFGMGSDQASTYVTVRMGDGRVVLTFTDGMTKLGRPVGLTGAILPVYAYASADQDLQRIGLSRLVVGTKSRFIGISTSLTSLSTQLEIGDLDLDSNAPFGWPRSQTTLPVTGFPSIFHSYDRINYVGDDVFMNVAAAGLAQLDGNLLVGGDIASRRGYLMVDRSAGVRSPYGSADGIAPLPVRPRANEFDVVHTPGIFPARDGSLYTLSYRVLGPEAGGETLRAMYFVGHYTADGQPIGTTELELGGFTPFFSREALHAFDGVDSFYLSGFTPSGLGVAKLSLTDGGYDKDYGVKGVADFSSPEGDPGRFFQSRLTVQSDGSVDAFATRWGTRPDEFGRFPLQISTVRFTPAGKVDGAKPGFTVSFPELERCGCLNDALTMQIARNAVVDGEGRLVVAIPDLSFLDEDGKPVDLVGMDRTRGGVTFEQTKQVAARAGKTLAGGQIRRYTRDGLLDQTFGVEGASAVSLYELGAEVPLGVPSIAVSSEGNIFVTVMGLELDVPKDSENEFDIVLAGEYAYSVLMSNNGSLINFTPRETNPAAKKIADLVNDSRKQLGIDAPLAAPPQAAGGTPVLAAPPGLSADVVVPAEVVQVNPTKRPIISVLGTPADRAIDVRWSVPESLAGSSASYTVTATPGGQKCTTATTSCVFKKLDPWTAYTFSIKSVSASSGGADVSPAIAIKPVRIVKRDTRTEPTKLITPASTGKQTWKATGGCNVSKDGKTFTTPKDAALCTLSLTTAKAGKVPKTTRTITVVVRAVAK